MIVKPGTGKRTINGRDFKDYFHSDVQNMIALNKMRETEIADKWARGIVEKDADKVAGARAEMAEWNSDNPESPIRINTAQLLKRIKAMREDKAARMEKTAPNEIKATVRRELAAA